MYAPILLPLDKGCERSTLQVAAVDNVFAMSCSSSVAPTLHAHNDTDIPTLHDVPQMPTRNFSSNVCTSATWQRLLCTPPYLRYIREVNNFSSCSSLQQSTACLHYIMPRDRRAPLYACTYITMSTLLDGTCIWQQGTMINLLTSWQRLLCTRCSSAPPLREVDLASYSRQQCFRDAMPDVGYVSTPCTYIAMPTRLGSHVNTEHYRVPGSIVLEHWSFTTDS